MASSQILPNALHQSKIALIFSAPSGCGKTTILIRLWNYYYRHQFDRLFIFCPTIASIENQDTYPYMMTDDQELYIFDTYDEQLITECFKSLEGPQLKHSLFVFDDCTSCDGFCNPRRKSGITNLISTIGRHSKISTFYLMHNLMALNPIIRGNCDGIFLWQINGIELEHVRKQYTIMDRRSFVALYDYATRESRYDFMYINQRTRKCYKNFNLIELS
jgi:Poxvirus A32 protein